MLDHFAQRCERRVGNGRALSVAGAAGCAVSEDYFKTCVPTRHGRAASCNNSVAAEAVTQATLDHRGGAGRLAKLVLSVRLQQLIVERLYQVGK